MDKLNIWFAGNEDEYSTYLQNKIKKSENFSLSEIFYNKKALIKALKINEPDLLILDLESDKKKLLEKLNEINKINNNIKVILLIDEEDEEFIQLALCKGVYDYFIKDNKVVNIDSKLLEVYKSKTPLASVLNNKVKRTFEKIYINEMSYSLSSREKEILNLMIGGFTKKKMAEMLSLSFHTIDSHLRKIYKKLGVRTKTQAVSKALKEQLLAS